MNVETTNVVHFRTSGTVQTHFEFKCSGVGMEISESYNYLGLVFNEYIDKEWRLLLQNMLTLHWVY